MSWPRLPRDTSFRDPEHWFWTNITVFEHLVGLVKHDHSFEYENIADDLNIVAREIGLPTVDTVPFFQKTDIDWSIYVENIDEVRDWFDQWSQETKNS